MSPNQPATGFCLEGFASIRQFRLVQKKKRFLLTGGVLVSVVELVVECKRKTVYCVRFVQLSVQNLSDTRIILLAEETLTFAGTHGAAS